MNATRVPIISLLLVVGLLQIACSAGDDGPEAAFKEFYVSLYNGLQDRAYERLSAQAQKRLMNQRDAFKDQPSIASPKPEHLLIFKHNPLGRRILKITTQSQEEERARVQVEFDQGSATFTLVREEGEWKVDLFKD